MNNTQRLAALDSLTHSSSSIILACAVAILCATLARRCLSVSFTLRLWDFPSDIDLVSLARVREALALCRFACRVRTDFLMRLGVHLLKPLLIDPRRDEFREVGLILGGILLLKHLHVLLHVLPKDASLVRLGIVLRLRPLLLRGRETREVLAVVRHVEPTVNGPFQGGPDAVTGGGTL